MTDPLEGRVDAERDFPRRYIWSEKKRQAWIDAHNPHPKSTWEWLNWTLRFRHDQLSAMTDASRSRMAFASRYILFPFITVSLVFNLTMVIIQLATGGLK